MSWTRCISFAALAAVLVLAGCQPDDVVPLKIGSKAPPFTLDLVDGRTLDSKVSEGNGRVIAFTASWCPCTIESMPLMKQAYARFKEQDIAFLMIGIQDAESKFGDFVARKKVPFPAGYDDGDKIARAYGVTAPPTTIFVDRTGQVKRVFFGNIKDKETEFLRWTEELL
jgi:peroxiredoxin